MYLDERLAVLVRILDPDDYRYVGAFDLRKEKAFRRTRMSIYRSGLCDISTNILDFYHQQLSSINAAARWDAYPRVLIDTAGMFISLAKLWMAGCLFSMRLPALINVNRQHQRLVAFLGVEGSARLHHSRV